MHPAIKEFWTKVGYTPSSSGPPMDIWSIYIPLGGPLPISLIEVVCHGDKYRYEKQWYSEEQMLRLIKQKAFI